MTNGLGPGSDLAVAALGLAGWRCYLTPYSGDCVKGEAIAGYKIKR